MEEIERKFLVRSIPFVLENSPVERIRQGYLLTCANGGEIRVRQKNKRFVLTVKTGVPPKRQETEIEINRSQFRILWAATTGRRLEKRRYSISMEGHLIEIDVFLGNLKGLLLVEVEFPSLADSETFRVPDWFELEVTEDERFFNRNLAAAGTPPAVQGLSIKRKKP